MTIAELIKRAMRRLRVLAAGEDPEGDEQADAVEIIQAMYLSLINAGKQCSLVNDEIDADDLTAGAYEAEEDTRVQYTGSDPATASITLPATITDDDGTVRAPRDLACVIVAGPSGQTWIYEANAGDWVRLDALAVDDNAPLYAHLSEELIALAAVSLADEFGAVPSALTLSQATAGRLRLIGRMQSESVFLQPDRTNDYWG